MGRDMHSYTGKEREKKKKEKKGEKKQDMQKTKYERGASVIRVTHRQLAEQVFIVVHILKSATLF